MPPKIARVDLASDIFEERLFHVFKAIGLFMCLDRCARDIYDMDTSNSLIYVHSYIHG